LRKQLAAEEGVKVSVNDMVVRAVALALRDVPAANAKWNAGMQRAEVSETVDVAVAVATDGGLITPILPRTDGKGLQSITNEVRDLASRARSGKLKPQEYQGGSFTISNLGMFGIDEFTAVINPPQACILAVARGERRVLPSAAVVDVDAEEAPGAVGVAPLPTAPRVATVMRATLSADRRVVDEAVAGQFLQVLRHYLENPRLMLL
ncbi:MAG: 2-oxo acid dehydrogenase subunit E2, partial [Bacteroidia bacterium]